MYFFLFIVLGWMPVNAEAIPHLDFGKVVMSTSGTPAAQEHFLQGVAAMHLFEYKEARREFQEARRLDPSFALAYWGEAMSYTQLLWQLQDSAAAEAAIQQLGKTTEERLSKAKLPLEKEFIRSLDYLYGPASTQQRIENYCQFMGELYNQYPLHSEVVSFYALALLGSIPSHTTDETKRIKAAGIIDYAFGWNPSKDQLRHPGMLHYLIHAVDDRDHAWLGLKAADVIAAAAPDSPHAIHMPAHIYAALGLWNKALQANTLAYEVSLRRGEPDLHVLQWLLYTHLQTGRYAEAKSDIQRIIAVTEKSEECSLQEYLLLTMARYAVGTKDFSLLFPSDKIKKIAGCEVKQSLEYFSYLYAEGAAALQKNEQEEVKKAIDKLLTCKEALNKQDILSIDEREYRQNFLTAEIAALQAQQAWMDGYKDQALLQIKMAAEIEQGMAPLEMPELVMSPLEIYGDMLIKQQQWKEAATVYRAALNRVPNCAACYMGLAHAALALHDERSAIECYRHVLAVWNHADEGLKGPQEARQFLSQ